MYAEIQNNTFATDFILYHYCSMATPAYSQFCLGNGRKNGYLACENGKCSPAALLLSFIISYRKS